MTETILQKMLENWTVDNIEDVDDEYVLRPDEGQSAVISNPQAVAIGDLGYAITRIDIDNREVWVRRIGSRPDTSIADESEEPIVPNESHLDDSFCSICYEPVPDDPVDILEHIFEEHRYEEPYYSFIAHVRIPRECAVCGREFDSDVEPNRDGLYMARPACRDCRRQHPVWKGLRTETIGTRELVEQGRLERAREGVA